MFVQERIRAVMSRQARRAYKRAQARKRQRKKQINALSKRDISKRAFQVAFASTLMAVKDIHPELAPDLPKITARINDILAEVATVGNKEYEMFCTLVQDEFSIKLRGI